MGSKNTKNEGTKTRADSPKKNQNKTLSSENAAGNPAKDVAAAPVKDVAAPAAKDVVSAPIKDVIAAPANDVVAAPAKSAPPTAELIEQVKKVVTAENCATSKLWRVQAAYGNDSGSTITHQQIGVGMAAPCDSATVSKISEYASNPQGLDLLARAKPVFDAKCSFPAGFVSSLAAETTFTCALAGTISGWPAASPTGEKRLSFCGLYLFEKVTSQAVCLEKCKLSGRGNLIGVTLDHYETLDCRFFDTPLM